MGCSVEGAGKSLHLPRGDAPQAHTARGSVEGDFAQRQKVRSQPTGPNLGLKGHFEKLWHRQNQGRLYLV